ncbi:hypothetical protein HZC27_03680 [Candidatus Roizmanbacteria bacterium]|nr:hypothetical protein [Candidatus Roizmanbacteria bacterium]
MCRFLLYKSKLPQNPQAIIQAFSRMAKKSKAFDGDWQGDGWGISWLENNAWKSYKSIKPIWEDRTKDSLSFSSKLFLIHSRSASFSQHKNNLEYNQPFTDSSAAFVFNGLIKGVSLHLPGEIGSQKIWSLVQKKLLTMSPEKTVKEILRIILKNSKTVQALNMGIADKKYIYALCYYSIHKDYYSLHYSKKEDVSIISSEPIDGFDFKTLSKGEVIQL